MNKRLGYLVGGLFVALSATAVVAQTSSSTDAAGSSCGAAESTQQARARATLVSGTDVAIAGNALVTVADGAELELRPCGDNPQGVLRHLSVLPDNGAAYVVDQAGQDVLTFVGPDGSNPVAVANEVSHPSWSDDGRLVWAENMQVLKVMSADHATTDAVVLPAGAVAAFSPVFTDDRTITTVVQEVVAGAPPEDESLNNLWSFDLATRKWSKETSFVARGPRWSAIRTPVVTPTGEVLFVRITADSRRTTEPVFELWRSTPEGAHKVSDLPGEMYLAGWAEDGALWNAPSRRCGDWGLFADRHGELEQIGCGAVMTDPLALADPDLMVDEHGSDAGETSPVELAIVVGDFSSVADARAVATSLGEPSSLVSHRSAPSTIRPGAWGLLLDVEGGAAEQRLETVRRQLDGCDCGAWLVPRP